MNCGGDMLSKKQQKNVRKKLFRIKLELLKKL